MNKLCAYCGYTIIFPAGESTTKCSACARENTLTKFEQQIDLLKLSEEEKARVEIALQKATADKEKLSAELSHVKTRHMLHPETLRCKRPEIQIVGGFAPRVRRPMPLLR